MLDTIKKEETVINSNINNLLKKIRIWQKSFYIHSNPSDSQYQIILKEKNPSPQRVYPRRIVLSIKNKPISYSIRSYEIELDKNKEEKFNQIYAINIEGENDFNNILDNLLEIIQGKDTQVFDLNYTF